MRKSSWRTAGWVVAGAVIGSIAGELLAHKLPWLGASTTVRFNPSGDWAVVQFAIDITFRVNWLTLAGIISAYLISRRIH